MRRQSLRNSGELLLSWGSCEWQTGSPRSHSTCLLHRWRRLSVFHWLHTAKLQILTFSACWHLDTYKTCRAQLEDSLRKKSQGDCCFINLCIVHNKHTVVTRTHTLLRFYVKLKFPLTKKVLITCPVYNVLTLSIPQFTYTEVRFFIIT